MISFDLQAQFMRTLGHPIRLRILDILAHQEACVCHLTTILGRPQPYVSQQLATLRDGGLVSDRREGTLIYYRLTNDHLAAWLDSGKELVRDSDGNPASFAPVPEEALAACPCPRCQEAFNSP
jgi:DNA-binding transcriptional ArsR family regulator